MAQMNTKWYSGNISTSSPVSNQGQAISEDTQIFKEDFANKSSSASLNPSKASISKQTPTTSGLQAGRSSIVESKRHCPISGSILSLNLTPESFVNFVSKNGAFNEHQVRPIKPISNNSNKIEISLPFTGGIAAFNKQQMNEIKPTEATADLSYWFPYYFVQALRRKLQDSASQFIGNRTIEIHYIGNNDMATTSATNGNNIEIVDINKHRTSLASYKKCGTIQIHRQISYKCPKKNPKFKAKFFELNKSAENIDERFESFRAKTNGDDPNTKLTAASKHLFDTKQQLDKTINSSPSSNEQNLNRNISPISTTKSFKWPSDNELELNLESLSPSSVSSPSAATTSCTTSSGVRSALKLIETGELTTHEMPTSPLEHELYLAKIEKFKEQLMSSIKDSKAQRKVLDNEESQSASTAKTSNVSLKTSNNSKHYNREQSSQTGKIVFDSAKPPIKRSKEKQQIEQKKNSLKSGNTASNIETTTASCTPTSTPTPKVTTELPTTKSFSSNDQIPVESLFKNRLKRFIEESKSINTSLDIEAASATMSEQSPITTNTTAEISQISAYNFSTERTPSSGRELLKNRLKCSIHNIAKARKSLTLERETSCELVSSTRTQRTYDRPQNSRNIDISRVSSHDKEQIVSINQLKERLRRSIKDFKNDCRTSEQDHQQDHRQSVNTSETKYLRNQNLSVGHVGHIKENKNSFHSEQETRTKPKRTNNRTARNKPIPKSEDPLMTAPQHETKMPARDRDRDRDEGRDHHVAKFRNQASMSTRHQQTSESQSYANKDSKKHQSVSYLKGNSAGNNNLRQSKAQTSLHSRSGSDKENKTPTDSSDLKRYRKHKNNKNKVTTATTTKEPTKSRTTQTKPLRSDIAAKPKRATHTATKGTQCSHIATTDLLDDQDLFSDFENFSNEMDLETFINPQTTRSEALSDVLKVRYKSLVERAKGEFAWLQLKKERYQSKGLHEKIAAIRKKQQQILKKMETERYMIQRLLESALAMPFLQTADASGLGQQRKFKLSKSKSAPDIHAAVAAEHEYSLSKRLERVECMLAWNFRLDEKEADIAELEQMLLDCNYSLDITPTSSAKSLLYRINKIENRLSKISEKLSTLEHNACDANAHLINEDFHETPNCCHMHVPHTAAAATSAATAAGGGKLNQFWQRLTSPKHGKFLPKRQMETKLKHHHYSDADDTYAYNASKSSSTQYVVYDPTNYFDREQQQQQQKHISKSTDDDGIIVLYSPKVPSFNLNFSSCNSEFNEEGMMSPRSHGVNPTFSLTKRYARTSDRKSSKSK